MTRRIALDAFDDPIEIGAGLAMTWGLLARGVPAPFGCHWGNCGVCRARLVSGTVAMQPHSARALPAGDRAAGWILACRAVPETDCRITWDPNAEWAGHPLQRAQGHVTGITAVTADIRIVQVHLAEGTAFAFSAGQYAVVGFGAAAPRDYSMANRPGANRPGANRPGINGPGLNGPGGRDLVFHVRCMPGGATSAYVATDLAPGMPVGLEGPYGTCWLRPGHRGPILAVAGGTGLAPIQAILAEALAHDPARRIVLYIGARGEDDLYGIEALAALARRCPGLRIEPVVDAAESGRYREGPLAAAIRTDFAGLADPLAWKAYLAGPPPMIGEVEAALDRIGIAPAARHADPFYSEAEMRAL